MLITSCKEFFLTLISGKWWSSLFFLEASLHCSNGSIWLHSSNFPPCFNLESPLAAIFLISPPASCSSGPFFIWPLLSLSFWKPWIAILWQDVPWGLRHTRLHFLNLNCSLLLGICTQISFIQLLPMMEFYLFVWCTPIILRAILASLNLDTHSV